MSIEIEKKYRLSQGHERVLRRLSEVGAVEQGAVVFEENIIYHGPGLDPRRRVLRLRRVGARSVFTFKERRPTDSPIKHQREDETDVSDADALAAILDALGYAPALVYEKRRRTWKMEGVEVVLDELPFGLFMEIEGEEEAINRAEQLLDLEEAEAEHASYPELAQRHGRENNGAIEARF